MNTKKALYYFVTFDANKIYSELKLRSDYSTRSYYKSLLFNFSMENQSFLFPYNNSNSEYMTEIVEPIYSTQETKKSNREF